MIAWILAGALVAGGVILITTGGAADPMGSASFGWFAYQPVAELQFTEEPGLHLSRTAVAGWVMLAIGLLAVAFFAGPAVGRRSRN